MIRLNTNIISDKGENIINLSKEYNMVIDKLFDILTTLDQSSWNGPTAKKYSEMALFDRTQYKVLGNSIEIYGKKLKQTAELYDSFVKKWDL